MVQLWNIKYRAVTEYQVPESSIYWTSAFSHLLFNSVTWNAKNSITRSELGMNNAQLNNANNGATLSNILNNHVIIQSHTTINENGRLQSYCGLKLINILSPQIGKNSTLFLSCNIYYLFYYNTQIFCLRRSIPPSCYTHIWKTRNTLLYF